MRIAVFFILIIFQTSLVADPNTLRLATTTSTKASGLSDVLFPLFEKESGYKVLVSIVGTGSALRLGRSGMVDVILVHAPDEEIRFVNEGFGIKRHRVMYNDFLLVGPAADPARVKSVSTLTEAFLRIASSKQLFISRADDSGTHKKELAIWKKSGADPYGASWYFEFGAGMGQTLKLSSKDAGYTITDRGSWLAMKKTLSLASLFEGDELLQNPYGVIAVSARKGKYINLKAAQAFINWLLSEKVKNVIGDYKINGNRLFTPYR